MSQLELNKGDDFIFAIDVSGSMQTKDTPTGASRIDYVKEQLKAFITNAVQWDTDGVEVFTFGAKITDLGKNQNGAMIDTLKATESSTMTHLAIQHARRLAKVDGGEQTVLFIITDGEPSDPDAVKETIRGIAAELKDEHEFAISILTVGKRSPALDQFLTDLDDNLKAKHDIVDVRELESTDFEAAFAAALHD